jgi:hypothetical protein
LKLRHILLSKCNKHAVSASVTNLCWARISDGHIRSRLGFRMFDTVELIFNRD